ncbi:Ribonucleoprotein LSM domain eukaryotic/archaea-type [Penicillium argentinense]|uniref:Ribonucleoprotein LSM domain eukaryotic/archaea-type n=1 Tax=Penicillium argentinense TaxID=1131581 RepID=A0A9W9JVI9_9EURO|nr:Ribonucleoprotein LSM domain eukaryotic/archaea-type [Penicillium argentinense]KAJ5082682.1 Ribonucleoprotein LSM domain eukaryotic/archaea-type [Penicillium argentinense]
MSERGSFRGGRGGRGGRPQQQKSGGGGGAQEKPKKENILDLSKYIDKQLTVKFNGGREATGTLKGYDQLMNLVLDDVKETMRGKYSLQVMRKTSRSLLSDEEGNQTTRTLGLMVARGTLIVLISPADGSEEIPNPFVQPEE